MTDFSIDSLVVEAEAKGFSKTELDTLREHYARVDSSYRKVFKASTMNDMKDTIAYGAELAYKSTRRELQRIIDKWHTKQGDGHK